MAILNNAPKFEANESNQIFLLTGEKSSLELDRPFEEGLPEKDILADSRRNEQILNTLLESIIESKGSSSSLHWSSSSEVFPQTDLQTIPVSTRSESIVNSFLCGQNKESSEEYELSRKDNSPYAEISQPSFSPRFDMYSSSSDASGPERMVFKIRHLTGFDWDDLASLLNVAKETLVGWMQGNVVPKENRRHIKMTLETIGYIDRGTAEMNSKELKSEIRGQIPYSEIQNGNYTLAEQLIGAGEGRTEIDCSERGWIGEYRPMLEHSQADGTEKPPLPLSEPIQETRRRTVRRV